VGTIVVKYSRVAVVFLTLFLVGVIVAKSSGVVTKFSDLPAELVKTPVSDLPVELVKFLLQIYRFDW
jgi:hypothetical protein